MSAPSTAKRLAQITQLIEKVTKMNKVLLLTTFSLLTACGKTHLYPIDLREDSQGETDFSVQFKAQ